MHKGLNIKNSFNIIEKFKNHYDGLWIVSCQGKSMYSFYARNYNLLENFLSYFRETGSDLIRKGEENKIFLMNDDPEYLKTVTTLNNQALSNDNHPEHLKPDLRLKKHFITHNNLKIRITPKELICLKHLGEGFSYKEIGNILHISSRTVETHIRNIKNKFDVSSQDMLLKIYHSNALKHLL